jgi:hypothetical protein
MSPSFAVPVSKMGTDCTKKVRITCPQGGYEEGTGHVPKMGTRNVYGHIPKMGTRKVQTAMSPRWCDRNMKTVKYDFSQRAYTVYSPYTHNYHMPLVYKEISHEITKLQI